MVKNTYRNDYDRRFLKLTESAGFGHYDKQDHWVTEWPINAMRHSFGSYHFALYGDSIKTSLQMGHKQSDTTLFEHYRALTTESRGQKYFDIKPPKSAEKVVKFAV